MRVTYISSATVVIEHEGTRVLCDPWLTDGIQYGSWFHYPVLKHKPEDFSDVDYIYISHVHQDHMDPATMRRLPKHIPVLILDFEEKYVLRILKGFGFERVIELQHGQAYPIIDDFSMAIYGADDCDPRACWKEFGCSPPASGRSLQVDSMAVFSTAEQVLVNNNDCPYPLARPACDRILRDYGHVDMLLTGYSGASGYPQCYEYEPEETLKRAVAKRQKCLRMAQSYIRQLQPRYFMPFAGQYVLGGRLGVLNDMRGMPELEELPYEFARMGVPSELVMLNDGESFDLDTEEVTDDFAPPNRVERYDYVQTLADRTYPYDDRLDPGDLLPSLLTAQKRMQRYQWMWGYASDWSLYFAAGEHTYRVPFNGDAATRTDQLVEPFVRITLDPALFGMILNREAHLNNAEGGSHLRICRRPDTYERMAMWMSFYLQN